MAVGYWHNLGRPRHRVAAFEHGYHGDTFGAMSVGARASSSAPSADAVRSGLPAVPGPGREQRTVEAFESLLRDHEGEIAALIVEPLVLGAAGTRLSGVAADRARRTLPSARRFSSPTR